MLAQSFSLRCRVSLPERAAEHDVLYHCVNRLILRILRILRRQTKACIARLQVAAESSATSFVVSEASSGFSLLTGNVISFRTWCDCKNQLQTICPGQWSASQPTEVLPPATHHRAVKLYSSRNIWLTRSLVRWTVTQELGAYSWRIETNAVLPHTSVHQPHRPRHHLQHTPLTGTASASPEKPDFSCSAHCGQRLRVFAGAAGGGVP